MPCLVFRFAPVMVAMVALAGGARGGAAQREGGATEAAIYEAPALTVAGTPLDGIVEKRLAALGLRAAPACSDAVFVRRVFLDVTGTLPTAAEAREFLSDGREDRRARLIERLLARPEYADYQAMRWSDVLRIKAEFPINLWPNAAQAYHRWLVESFRANRPADAMMRELLVSNGSNFRQAPANFYRAVQNRTPDGLAGAVALTFFGMRAENWPREQRAGLAGFFTQVRYKATGEWKEEIVYFDASAPSDPERRAVFPDGTPARPPAGQDPRAALADWMLDPAHPWLARAWANRTWAWLLGRGIVHEPDDLRPDNPPVNPELLAYLERELVASRYDLKALQRLILNSRTYQRSALPADPRPEALANFASYGVRRIEAEVLADALNQITGASDVYVSAIPEPFTYVPADQRAVALPDASISGVLLEKFGRSPRDTGLWNERDRGISAAQRLHLLNSSHILRKIDQGPALRRMLKPDAKRRGVETPVDELYLTVLSRRPTDAERAHATSPGVSTQDVAWALINGAEFLYRH